DYIYTDPPYGKKIPYLDLSTMWTSWLDLKITEQDYKQEAIEGGSHDKSKDEYGNLIVESMEEMFRVLKWNRWMSIVFQHQDPYFWHLIVDRAEKIGFEYAGALKQENGQTSFKKRKNPHTVLSGQMIINFKKVQNPYNRLKFSLGGDDFKLILNHIEAIIAKNSGATLEEIYSELMVYGLENGYLDKLSKEYADLTPIMNENFDYDEKTEKYHISQNKKFRAHIPVEMRVRYFLESFLIKCERTKKYPTFNEIVRHILPLLKNGITPEEQKIREVLNLIAYQYGEDKWRIQKNPQGNLGI
ncbi:MAG: DNA methyltransferase, partial [Alphaproteobacteria bacterium]